MHQKSEIYSTKIFLVRDATASARRQHAAGTKRGRSTVKSVRWDNDGGIITNINLESLSLF